MVDSVKPKILLIGSGMMTGPFIEYILQRENNRLTVASNSRAMLNETLKKFAGKHIDGVELDVTKDEKKLERLIKESFIVISFVPPTLHPIVAQKCLDIGRHLLTSSYESPFMKKIKDEVKSKNLIFMNEMGLDPGLDHIITHKVIHEEEQKGNKIIAFESWCGALPAPEVCGNPFIYKFSWSPKGALIAMNNSVSQFINGKELLIDSARTLTSTVNKHFHPSISLEGYYNRDSFPYIESYNLKHAHTVIRGTLRYKGSTFAFQCLKNLGLFESTTPIESKHSNWRSLLTSIIERNSQKNISKDAIYSSTFFIPSNKDEHSQQESKFYYDLCALAMSLVDVNYIKANEGYNHLFEKAYEVFQFLDFYNEKNKLHAHTSNIDALSVLLEDKLKMEEGERDVDFMQNEFTILTKNGEIEKRVLDLVVFGNHNNSGHSATAITVGATAAIGTQMIIDGKIEERGVMMPTSPKVVDHVLKEMEKMKIFVTEKKQRKIKF